MDTSTRLQQYEQLLRQNNNALKESLHNLFLDKVLEERKEASDLIYDLRYTMYVIFDQWNKDIKRIVAAFDDINGTATIKEPGKVGRPKRMKQMKLPF